MTIQTAVKTATDRFKKEHNVYTPTELNSQLQMMEENLYIVDGLIPARSLGVLVGDSGLGKSAYLYQLALCVATGIPFNGYPTTCGKVLYLDFENGLSDVSAIVSNLTRHLGLTQQPNPKRFLMWNFNNPSGNGRSKPKDILQMVGDFRPSLVIVDSLSSYNPDGERNNPSILRALHQLRSAIRNSGASIICVHHIRKTSTRKNEAQEPLEGDMRRWFEQARGPSALINGSDVRIGVAKPQSTRISVPGKENAEIAFVTRGFARVHGEIPVSYIARTFDSSGKPLGYTRLTGVDLLFNSEHEAAYHKLPNLFRFKDAKLIFGKGAESTNNFLKKCIALGVLRKTSAGYKKIPTK